MPPPARRTLWRANRGSRRGRSGRHQSAIPERTAKRRSFQTIRGSDPGDTKTTSYRTRTQRVGISWRGRSPRLGRGNSVAATRPGRVERSSPRPFAPSRTGRTCAATSLGLRRKDVASRDGDDSFARPHTTRPPAKIAEVAGYGKLTSVDRLPTQVPAIIDAPRISISPISRLALPAA